MVSLLTLIRREGRGVKALALLACLKHTTRVGRASRGYLFAGAGVVVASVAVVSLLTWLEPDSDKPSPFKIADHFLPEVVKQVDGQVATLLGVDKDAGLESVHTALASVRAGLGAVLRPASASPLAPFPLTTSPTSTSHTTASKPVVLSPATQGSPSQTMSEPPPPARVLPPPTTSQPTTPPS